MHLKFVQIGVQIVLLCEISSFFKEIQKAQIRNDQIVTHCSEAFNINLLIERSTLSAPKVLQTAENKRLIPNSRKFVHRVG